MYENLQLAEKNDYYFYQSLKYIKMYKQITPTFESFHDMLYRSYIRDYGNVEKCVNCCNPDLCKCQKIARYYKCNHYCCMRTAISIDLCIQCECNERR